MRETLEGEVIAALFRMGSPNVIRPADVALQLNEARGLPPDADPRNPDRVSPEKIGHALKRLGIVNSGRDEKGKFYRTDPMLLQRLRETYLPDGEAEGIEAATTSLASTQILTDTVPGECQASTS
jgi:hypothetical protein